ncbi:MAG: DSD1 family PLP-dependent enzyme [Burkholderiales bacterium]|nr:DSD1 family PLP-dependent enzyme [Burkholderiales bacterium]
MQLSDLETPALLLDVPTMDANIARMRAHLRALGVGFRPHVKTAKSADVVRRFFDGGTGPITVSTLKEAEAFADQGCTDILYAVGIAPNKLAHAARLRARGVDLTVLVDNVEIAGALAAQARAQGAALPALIEIDSDGHRAGVAPESADLLAVGRALHAAGSLAGVMTHAGASYDCRSVAAIRAMAEQERSRTVRAAARLRDAGLPCPVVSVGSSPTATYAERLDGVTEVRAGVFVFFDLVMAGIGVCRVEDLALSVLTTVIGHQRERGWLVTDAGWMALSRDRGTASQPVDQGYGLVCDAAGALLPDIVMTGANQEHGILAHRSGDPARMPMLPVGTLLRILPNHACATGAQHDRYHAVRGASPEIEAVWPRFSGW